MVVSQAVMVAVMTMTPLHMRDHDHSVQLVGFVLAVHIAGMYALAPLVGRLNDRIGGHRTIVVGGAVLASSTIVTALAGAAPSLLFVGLFLLGLGWSIGLIAGSSMLTGAVAMEHRTRVQGAGDLTMSLCGGAAGLVSGLVKFSAGYHMLSNIGTFAAGLLLVVALGAARTAEYRRV
jgi:MFS family permease